MIYIYSLTEDVNFPMWDKRKLPLLSKVPHSFPGSGNRPLKYRKNLIDIRGPELVHNKLIHKQFGIQVCIYAGTL